MQLSRLAIVLLLGSAALATSAAAAEQAVIGSSPSTATTESVVDCSKENWPNFSASCLRNANSAVPVRLVTGNRRQ